jgi:hypothetical protein
MTMTKSLIISAIGILGLASACAVDSDMSAEEVASGEDAVCANESGTNAAMASLAVATAMELKRWEPRTDFKINTSTYRLELTPAGKSRCGSNCKNVETILAWQDPIYAGKIKFPGGATLEPSVFKDRLNSRFEAQRNCDARPSNQAGSCSAEKHDLKYLRNAPGSCDTNYFFHAYKPGTTTNIQYPVNLKFQLLWVGWDKQASNSNPYLAFDVEGDDIQVDPTAGGIINDPAASGSCPAVCMKVTLSNVSGNCCVCNGKQGKLQYAVAPPVGTPYMFTCQ